MNKKITLALASLAVAFALYSCDNGATTTSTEVADTSISESVTSNPKIVYVDTDSLTRGYEYYKQLEAEYKVKAEKAQKELENRSRSLERKMTDAQNKVQKGLVTRTEASNLEQSLQLEQQNLIQYRDETMATMREEEIVMINKIWNNITEYLQKYNDIHQYDLIINQNSATNSVILSAPGLNITTDVLNGLNKEFASGINPSEK